MEVVLHEGEIKEAMWRNKYNITYFGERGVGGAWDIRARHDGGKLDLKLI